MTQSVNNTRGKNQPQVSRYKINKKITLMALKEKWENRKLINMEYERKASALLKQGIEITSRKQVHSLIMEKKKIRNHVPRK